MAINIQGVVKNIRKVNAYTPIIEAIVNAIESVAQSKRSDGRIVIKVVRDSQTRLTSDDIIPPVRSFEVTDNGVGFNDENLKSFDTLYTEYKISLGGKGFGRFTYLKFFTRVRVESLYTEGKTTKYRSFSLGKKESIVENLVTNMATAKEVSTTLFLTDLYDEYLDKYDKNLDTIAKRIVNSLLVYFITPRFDCPMIILEESDGSNSIILNEFVKDDDSIKEVASENFGIKRDTTILNFEVKIFKIYSANSQASSVILCGHNREVTAVPLYSYIPEFKDEFFETIETKSNENSQRNYIIRTYVLGDYLDDNVSLERSKFDIPKKKVESELIEEISQEEIESEAVNITQKYFSKDVTLRREKKKDIIQAYAQEHAPWYKPFIKDLDYSQIPYDATESDIELALHKESFKYEIKVKKDVVEILKQDKDFDRNINTVVKGLNEISKTNLAHYVVLRKSVLDIFKKSLQLNSNNNYDLEKVLHNIIFPLNANSSNTEYKDHNLWIIDERLSFHEYVSSDERLKNTDDRPDLLIFDKRVLVRNDNELSNPLYIFEFKRPQRNDYQEKDNPVKQVNRYVEQIRAGNFVAKDGRTIHANENTPAYGFIVCDLTPKIKAFCKDAQLTLSTDEQAYYGYHSTYKIYFEIISFDKLIKDSELRNKIFFKKLGIV